MKKQIKKLNLCKTTIANLNAAEMNAKAGGAKTQLCFTHKCPNGKTYKTCGTCAPF